MNVTEHLLTCLNEECVEVAQRCDKALRFGLREVQKSDSLQTLTNAERIHQEFTDLVAVYELLSAQGVLPLGLDRRAIDAKKDKVRRYLDYSREIGTLHD